MRDRDNITRSVGFRATEMRDDEGGGLTLEGYAAVFDEWTTISDRVGDFQERIAPGAFKRTLGIRTPVLQFDHGQHPLLGSMPLGRITKIDEDARGLFVRAKLSDNWMVQPVRDAIRDGAIDGMSFRFSVKDEEWENRDGVDYRTISEVALYEVGPVVFPAYEATSVGVRSRAAQVAAALTDPEVRQELAVLMLGTEDDLRHLADASPAPDQDSPAGTPVPAEAPTAEGHATVRTKTQRQALAALALDS